MPTLHKNIDARNEYDAVKSNRLRKQPVTERKSEGDIYTPNKRGKGTAAGRDIERNFAPGKGILLQFRQNVVGSLGKIQVNTPNGKQATDWFNHIWAKDCDFRDNMHWCDILQNVVAAIKREGDVLAVFDDDLIEDTGKLLFYETDQIVNVSPAVLKAKGFDNNSIVQDNGIIRDKWGRVLGYMTTGERGLQIADDPKKVTFWKKKNAVLARSPWRFNQGRGIPDMLTAANSFEDLYEMLSKELITAKKAAGQYAFIGRVDAVDDWEDPGTAPEFLPENTGRDAASVATDGANEETATGAKNYEAIEQKTGGYVDYGDPGDTITFPPADRPNVHMAEFIEAVLCHAGAAFGLARAYALMRADTSYTAFRGDVMMTWMGAFYPMQKWLERAFADRISIKVLQWAQRKKIIDALESDWEYKISWSWPKMPEVDRLKYEKSRLAALRNGTTSYSEELGPEWLAKFAQIKKEADQIEKLDLPFDTRRDVNTKTETQNNE